MIIRPEKSSDIARIQEITINAFQGHPYSENTEHLIVNALRDVGALTVSLVAEVDGEVVGHMAFSPVLIDGHDPGWYGAGPLSVQPGYQQQGIGSALVRAGLDELRKLGAGGCVLVGDPNYYARFGFKAHECFFLEGVPPKNLLAIKLKNGMPAGEIVFHEAFSVKA